MLLTPPFIFFQLQITNLDIKKGQRLPTILNIHVIQKLYSVSWTPHKSTLTGHRECHRMTVSVTRYS